jgi:selenide,water dikinase
VLCQLPPVNDRNVLVGTSTSDDAAAYRMDEHGDAIIQTLDFITPIVDDPYDFGRIAATNSISDIYAMGGRPLFALNIVCFPSGKLPLDLLAEILRGGAAAARQAGIEIVGGHSVDDAEPKYGLVVTGRVAAESILTNAGAQPGDCLVLTKPLGSGVLTTACKQGRLWAEGLRKVVDVMTMLNRSAAAALEGLQVHALTDVTGFGLLGHLMEMTIGSRVGARLHVGDVPVLSEVWPLAEAGVFPGGAKRNLSRVDPNIHWSDGISEATKLVLADPQTSGGLLIAVAAGDVDRLLDRLSQAQTLSHALIGQITAELAGSITVVSE